ncbi:MAG TPA: glycerol-3-phosphate dehydrogenase/oxidase [Anaerolineae bacterium]|nr:glycerol-3-phosphate dehydrogenase/oxidase [Anaerolineae bacterium]HOQ99687.1 glycerol-3-phosphate dehydrogenase/oxidase [Anaerolineae bacterium]HPL28278.1 glycerol-3-phosphate dehydrogenase/oxidase [Anaerolineae bacterium]
MWTTGWRDRAWNRLSEPWDVLIVGGGITGAGILREAVRLGLRALLVEQRDFSWGTSSRSSKLVHGGLRYLAQGKVGLTRASVGERKRLLEEGPGLIDPLGFLLATYKGDRPGRWTYKAGLSVYDLLALQWSHRHYSAQDFELLAPHIVGHGLKGGFRYGDAQTDDARLVLRVIAEAVAAGGLALNYAAAEEVLQEGGRAAGVRLADRVAGRTAEVRARVVINATGAWADRLRGQVGAEPRIRPLRGSHLIFPAWRLPVAQALSFLHPADHRPVFIFPWEGIALVGTTDLDHHRPLDEEPAIAPEEVSYLMAAVASQFPSLNLGPSDVIATFAGIRPVVGSDKADPSKESRDHVVWEEGGLLTVTGGKLTTFRLIALDALKAARRHLPGMAKPSRRLPVLDAVDIALPSGGRLDEAQRRHLLGRYGAAAPALVAAAAPGELEAIPGGRTLWAELRWAARAEGVVHLDDLLLRRVRLGLLLPQGGQAILERVRAIAQPELGWSDARWHEEEAGYLDLWRHAYSLPVDAGHSTTFRCVHAI